MPREKFLIEYSEKAKPIGIRYDALKREFVIGGFLVARYVMESMLREYLGLTNDAIGEPKKHTQQNKIQFTVKDVGYPVFRKALDTMRDNQITVIPTSTLFQVM